jgi:hypothetical protein
LVGEGSAPSVRQLSYVEPIGTCTSACGWPNAPGREGEGSNVPNALVVVLCAVAAASFWTVLGFALARRLVGPALALPIAPALGWAVHSAAALPDPVAGRLLHHHGGHRLRRRPGCRFCRVLTQRSRHDSPPAPPFPSGPISARRAGARCRGGDHAQGRHRWSRVRPADLRPLQGRR